MTTLPPRQEWVAMRALSERHANKRESFAGSPVNLERETSLELATSTLARLRSTN